MNVRRTLRATDGIMNDTVKLKEIRDPILKSKCAQLVLDDLPDWFGILEAKEFYIKTVCSLPFVVAFIDGECVGFFSGDIHEGHTGEIFVCGVKRKHHNKGIGTLLYNWLEDYFKRQGCIYVIVKTLSDRSSDGPYVRTRNFYRHLGFQSLLTLPEIWGENSPCLIMIKELP